MMKRFVNNSVLHIRRGTGPEAPVDETRQPDRTLKTFWSRATNTNTSVWNWTSDPPLPPRYGLAPPMTPCHYGYQGKLSCVSVVFSTNQNSSAVFHAAQYATQQDVSTGGNNTDQIDIIYLNYLFILFITQIYLFHLFIYFTCFLVLFLRCVLLWVALWTWTFFLPRWKSFQKWKKVCLAHLSVCLTCLIHLSVRLTCTQSDC